MGKKPPRKSGLGTVEGSIDGSNETMTAVSLQMISLCIGIHTDAQKLAFCDWHSTPKRGLKRISSSNSEATSAFIFYD